ncbi:uncharacterized protein LOC132195076 isoform X2 [Neocloeon triangulifer]|uniref:uncharacterized protein LOC132195076 isoform X2 n=1 Tax=Neocloeon triangulifer TaxID=2078957 RepID=UPI00286F2228|nr:uncharacterized protein LOC132195076 isoform X2 [Neocloeon triangulifer]
MLLMMKKFISTLHTVSHRCQQCRLTINPEMFSRPAIKLGKNQQPKEQQPMMATKTKMLKRLGQGGAVAVPMAGISSAIEKLNYIPDVTPAKNCKKDGLPRPLRKKQRILPILGMTR